MIKKILGSRKMIGRAGFAAVAVIGLSGCMYDGGIYGASDYGYYDGGYGYGYDDYGYDGYDPYYDDFNAGFPNIGYGGGWYNNYYYPGYGLYVYDRGGRYHQMDRNTRNYWGNWRRDWREHRGREGRRDWDRRNYQRPSSGRAPNLSVRPENIRNNDYRGMGRMAPAVRNEERERQAEQRRVWEQRRNQGDATQAPRQWRGRQDGNYTRPQTDGTTQQPRQWQGRQWQGRQDGNGQPTRQWRGRQDGGQGNYTRPQRQPRAEGAQPRQERQATPQQQRPERAQPATRQGREGRGFGRMRERPQEQ